MRFLSRKIRFPYNMHDLISEIEANLLLPVLSVYSPPFQVPFPGVSQVTYALACQNSIGLLNTSSLVVVIQLHLQSTCKCCSQWVYKYVYLYMKGETPTPYSVLINTTTSMFLFYVIASCKTFTRMEDKIRLNHSGLYRKF